MMLGWETNYSYHHLKRKDLTRTLPEIEKKNLMRLHEIETRTEYPAEPALAQAFYRQAFGYKPGDFPNCERVAARTIALPFHTGLTESDVDEVCATLQSLL